MSTFQRVRLEECQIKYCGGIAKALTSLAAGLREVYIHALRAKDIDCGGPRQVRLSHRQYRLALAKYARTTAKVDILVLKVLQQHNTRMLLWI